MFILFAMAFYYYFDDTLHFVNFWFFAPNSNNNNMVFTSILLWNWDWYCVRRLLHAFHFQLQSHPLTYLRLLIIYWFCVNYVLDFQIPDAMWQAMPNSERLFQINIVLSNCVVNIQLIFRYSHCHKQQTPARKRDSKHTCVSTNNGVAVHSSIQNATCNDQMSK